MSYFGDYMRQDSDLRGLVGLGEEPACEGLRQAAELSRQRGIKRGSSDEAQKYLDYAARDMARYYECVQTEQAKRLAAEAEKFKQQQAMEIQQFQKQAASLQNVPGVAAKWVSDSWYPYILVGSGLAVAGLLLWALKRLR